MTVIDRVHGNLVFQRRVKVLANHLAQVIPQSASVLDIGCGDGAIAHLILEKRPDLTIEGIDVLLRPATHIPVTAFDGQTIPHPDKSFDVVTFVDVLHHTEDPMILLREARRVARQSIVLKDHTRNGLLGNSTLRFMDYVGNARHGVALPYNYWSKAQWENAVRELNLTTHTWIKNIGLYPFPANLIFGRSLHFIARLDLNSEP